MWLCLAMNIFLSGRLNPTSYGYAINFNKTKAVRINHLLYLDDVTLMAAHKEQLNKEQDNKILEEFSRDRGMQFGMDECRTINITKGKLLQEPFQIQN